MVQRKVNFEIWRNSYGISNIYMPHGMTRPTLFCGPSLLPVALSDDMESHTCCSEKISDDKTIRRQLKVGDLSRGPSRADRDPFYLVRAVSLERRLKSETSNV